MRNITNPRGIMMAAAKGRKQAKNPEIPIDAMRRELGRKVNETAIRGERFIITRHGLPAAALVSIADLEKLEGSAA